jgi:hypothetical protein
MRAITNDDLWSAIRGLGLFSKMRHELNEIRDRHASNPLFASQVIAEAARQVIAVKWRR